MTPEQERIWEDWLATKPAPVQLQARKYPVGTRFLLHGQFFHVISYMEDGSLGLSSTNPEVDYERAMATRQALCRCCVDKLDALRVGS